MIEVQSSIVKLNNGKMGLKQHFKKNKKLYLFLIMLIAIILRIKFVALCDATDRAQVAMGMTNNLPPLYHYLSLPIFSVTGDAWYAPAIANIIMDVIIIFILFKLGSLLKSRNFGLLLSFLYAVYPVAILHAKHISPETTELFSLVIITFLFIKYELSKEKSNILLFLLFLAVTLGAFSKQQTLIVLIPIGLFLLWKYRLGIFRQKVFYALLFSPAPYLFFLLTHPEMLAALLVIYFNQPFMSVSTGHILFNVFGNIVVYSLPFFILLIFFFCEKIYLHIKEKKKQDRADKQVFIFFLIYFILISLLVMKTGQYIYMLTPALILFIGFFIFRRSALTKSIILILLLLYAIVGFYLSIPYVSINTPMRCEQDFIQANPILLDAVGQGHYDTRFFNRYNHFEDILKDEKYVLIGGTMGQEIKYNIYSRLYFPTVVNSDRFNDINYAIIIFPINETYQKVPAWDYQYTRLILNNSEVLFNETWINNKDFTIVKITDKEKILSSLPLPGDWRQRSRRSLDLE